ncbi:YggT family protein [Micrococcus endophyticus]|uniref:YggT family protein n=1 Tax=Micrococcus endophyticus TaxID=455343 RepID=UPI0034CE3C08
MQLLLALVYVALSVVLAALTVRIVVDVTQSFARRWRPTGAALVVASAVYAVTDPLMRPVRRAVPPVNLGGIGLDVAFLLVFLGVVLLRALVLVLAGAL